MEEYYNWRYNEFTQGFSMDAPTWMPAGSMLNMADDEFWEVDIQQNEIHRERGKVYDPE